MSGGRYADLVRPVGDQNNGRGEFTHCEQLVSTPQVSSNLRTEDQMSEKEPTKSQSTLCVELVTHGGVELFHSPEQVGYATVRMTDGIQRTMPIRSQSFRQWLSRLFFVHHRKTPSSTAVADAQNVLLGMAIHEREEHKVHVRIARDDDQIFLDLGDDTGRVVEVNASGWLIHDHSPVKFIRPAGLFPLPKPTKGGSLSELRRFLNTSDQDWSLIQAFLVACLNPAMPLPLLILNGEQGTAKSTTSRILKKLIDPSKGDLRQQPRDARDLMIAAANSWLLAFDNFSNVPAWLSDCFCRLATGGGFATRQLHTDAEEAIFEARRPVLMNGIPELAEHADLLDRAIVVRLQPIPDGARRLEKELWRDFERAQPAIFGAILEAAARALRDQSSVHLQSIPRMADFAIWAVAAEPEFDRPDGLSFLECYCENRSTSTAHVLEGEPFVDVMMSLVAQHAGCWEGTCSELLKQLKDHAPEDLPKSQDWPKRANVLSNRLSRLGSTLRTVCGLDVEFAKATDRKRSRIVTITDLKSGADYRPHRPDRPQLGGNGAASADDADDADDVFDNF